MVVFLNEIKVLEELLADFKTINTHTTTKIRVYIKHLKQEGKNKSEIRNIIDELMIKHYKGFVMADWDSKLKSMVNKFTKEENCKFKESIDEVSIFEEEINLIKSIGSISGYRDIEIEKVLFILLVLAKANSSEWVSHTSSDIFKLARFKYKARADIKQIQREKLIYDLSHFVNKDIINVTNFGKYPSIKLLFIEAEGKEVLKVKLDNIENVIVEYLKLIKKEDYEFCEVCGVEIKSKTRPQKYCSACAKKINIDMTKNNKKKKV